MASHNDSLIGELIEYLKIPSVSTDPERKGDVRRAAEFTRGMIRKAGLDNARLIEGEGHPLVYADWLGAPGRPTLLLYGHYDVQPPDPLDEWITPPFEPAIRNENIYARGAADDKGQVVILIKAVERLMSRDGKLPVNVRFLIEGEEEVGGHHIGRHVETHAADLGADAALICDTEMFAPGLPTLCVGLRGIVYGEIHVRSGERDLHSGVYGGAAPNAMQAAAEIVCALKDRSGRIQIPGFCDRVRPPSDEERRAWERLPFDEHDYKTREMGVAELVGEPGVPLFERLWARPTVEVHGIRGGFTGDGAKTVIPARAVVKISARLVADQNPEEAVEQISAAVRAASPPGVQAEFHAIHAAPASLVDPRNPFIRASADAMSEVFGKETVFIRSGGSIPIVGVFQRHLGIPSVMMGFGLPDDNLHAPNEKFHLPNLTLGIRSTSSYLEKLGQG